MKFLDEIRVPVRRQSISNQIFTTLWVLLLGVSLGLFSKFLDYRQAELPTVLMMIDQILDFHNFLGGFAPWILSAVCIAIYSHTPGRAAINVFTFFVGMVSSYYLYSHFIAGFFPKNYAMIWVTFTMLSPFLAFLCWYAKGKKWISYMLSAGIVGVLFNTSFAYGFLYISIRSWLNVIVLLIGVMVLRREKKEMLIMIGMGIILAVIMNTFIPFHIW